MTQLLTALLDEAVTLADSDLPSSEQVRPLVGALVKRLERLEQSVVGEIKPAPTPEPVQQPTELELAQRDLQAAQAKVNALETSDAGESQG